MNTLTTTILTILANAIVTGVIVYLVQKKIENSYAKQMEEFRTRLQYSNFEQQTKFVAMHSKRVEALEVLYEKYGIFEEGFRDSITSASVDILKKREIDKEAYVQRTENAMAKLNDFWRYFQVNRLFLTDNLTDQIWEVYRKASDAVVMVEIISVNPEASLPIEIPDHFKGIETKWGKGEAVLAAKSFEVSEQARVLENLYKSVADITNKEDG